ncbi:MAG: triose-phosphate isomerase [Proteobacteria bacterium]|nr:MAG: triose-phosphate isomerase [Pseudomonadota bacterium]
MAKKLIAGNWKMFKNVGEVRAFLSAVQERASEFKNSELVVFPQAPLLATIQSEWKEKGSFFAWGPQNIYWEEKGAFTGELAPALAKEFGATYALAGHSERRQFFGETNESAAKRALAAHAHGLKSIFCIGEQLAERDAGRTNAVLAEQLAALFSLSPKAVADFSIAYEPVWAIGTGRTATSAQAQEAHAFIRAELKKAWGADAASKVRLLYGGSVKPDNAKELMSQADVDGVLVGGASLEPASFLAIAAAGNV